MLSNNSTSQPEGSQFNRAENDSDSQFSRLPLPEIKLHQLVARTYELMLLALVAYYVWASSLLSISIESKTNALSLIGLVIDPAILVSANLLLVLKIVVYLLVGWWISGRSPRWVFVAAPLAFIAMMSTVIETHYFIQHQTNFVALAFVVLGAARWFGSLPANAGKQPAYLNVDPLPPWSFVLLLYMIGLSYTFSGIAKLYYSGWQWADGTALMMWVDINALNRDNLLFKTIVSSQAIASIMQVSTLIAETAAILVLFIPRLRVVFGAMLVGFHLSVEYLFGLNFYGNICLDFYLLILCYFVPEYRVNGLDFFRDLFSLRTSKLFFPGITKLDRAR